MCRELTFRPGQLDDAAEIARIHVQAWREAYAHLLPATALARLSVDERARRWTEIMSAGGTDVWIAADGATIIGWASTGRGRDPGQPCDLELEGIYVLASDYGMGAGQGLLDASIGAAPAYLWAAADNPRAHAFYRRNLFAPDAATKAATLIGTTVEIVRFVR